MTPAAQAVFDAAKATRDAMTGIEATHLDASEVRELVAAGLIVEHNGRDNRRLSARYPARMRAEDLRAKVAAKIATKRA